MPSARLIAQRLEQRLGQPVIFDYRPGAGSAIAATYVARAPADGYTILYATSTTMAINVSVHKNARLRSGQRLRAGRAVRA